MTKLVFECKTSTQRIKKINVRGQKQLEITIAQYTDEAMNEYKETIKTIGI